ncbi:DUF4124 domain-containing protein [Undibacterium sp.]|uniref:DUF4124 domain-containing protein n=1 Tax=Undibacterium sp. TaxID=1914977 RepID=UPI002731654A|nr:DUF4124 domain-containing protein [Undibacterium sp.]MDP1980495.1 DUF4124 domain-containing protein [Undibacterium sp.]
MKSLIALACFAVVSHAHAEAYKCTVNGKSVYQEVPCTGAGEKVKSVKADQVQQDDGYQKTQKDSAANIQALKAEYESLKEKKESSKMKAEIEAKLYNENLPKMRAEQEKADTVAAEKFEQQQKENIDTLKSCIGLKCSSSVYYVALKDMQKVNVEGTINNCSTQLIRNKEYLYCSVPITDGGRVRAARLQMELGVPENIPKLVKVKTDRIKSVNVY